MPFRGYIPLVNNQPERKFKFEDKQPLLSLAQVQDCASYAGVLSGKVSVCDIDDADEAKRLYRLVQAENLNCRVVQTTRGMHFYFAAGAWGKVGNTHHNCALGIMLDVRTGVNQYVKLKADGKVREILRDFTPDTLGQPYPHWLEPLGVKELGFAGMRDGAGRNSAIYGHILRLSKADFSKEETLQVCRWVNDYIFDEPLPAADFAKATRADAFPKKADDETPWGTDIAAAEEFVRQGRDKLLFTDSGGWYWWTGRRWERDKHRPIGFIAIPLDINVISAVLKPV